MSEARAALSSVPLLRDLGELASPAELLAAVAEEIGANTESTAEALVLKHVDRLQWPRLLLASLRSDAPVDATVRSARELADATRDLQGPLRFVLLLPDGLSWPASERPLVWEPLYGAPHPLPFHLPSRSLRDAGFDTYLSCRLYWEAAGRPSYLSAFVDLLERAAEMMMAADADDRIDRALDERWTALLGPPDEIESLFRAACDRAQARVVLRTGIVMQTRTSLDHLEAKGLCWRPPGSLHALLTPLAAFQLARGSVGASLPLEERVSLRRIARHNQLLGAWVLQLTGHVEREMVWRCQRDGRIQERLTSSGMLERLRAEQQRNPTSLAYSPSEDPLDYASFGDLISLLTLPGLGRNLPMSRQRLEEARHARNLSAHLRPVTWRAVHSVLLLLEQLGRA